MQNGMHVGTPLGLPPPQGQDKAVSLTSCLSECSIDKSTRSTGSHSTSSVFAANFQGSRMSTYDELLSENRLEMGTGL
jgi:hypothetical protein